VNGLDFFTNRSFNAFGQHYASLVSKHQLTEIGSHPWENWTLYKEHLFPEATSVAEVIFKYPNLYCDYLFLGLSKALRNSLFVFGPLAALLPLAFIRKKRPSDFIRLAQATLIGLLPILGISYLHVRYLARYYPLAILCALLALESPDNPRARKTVISVVIIAGLLWNFFGVWTDYSTGLLTESARVYWFPD
jgi:hypothetical protein